jgi:eukaryotic-like serine/threonine-protein kinase
VSDSPATADLRSGSRPAAPSGSAATVRKIGRYTVLSTLGSGAMGEVLRARDERLGREVAIKTVRNLLGMHADLFRQRFEAEARALAAMSHPAIVQVHDLGFEPPPDGEPYLVMELVDGPSLKSRMEQGRLSAADTRALGIQLARALEAAHARGILHRDIKPANILSTVHGQWKLADFGVAHVPDSSMTMTGQFLGTPAYAAPESLALGQFSEQSDVFSVAVTLVEALTGERLRGNATLSDLVRQSSAAVELPAGVPAELAIALRPALALDAAARPTAARFAELLAHAPSQVADPGTEVLGAAPHAGSVRGSIAPRAAAAPDPGTEVLGSFAPAPRAVTASPASLTGFETAPGAPAPRRSRLVWFGAGVAGAILLIGVIAAVSRGGGGGAKADPPAPPAAAAVMPSAKAADPAPPEREPVVERDRPRGPAGPIRISYPQGLDRKASGDWAKIAEKFRERDYDEALKKLDKFERKFGEYPETVQLRELLDQLGASYDD